jgi:hypothetical protein
MAGIDDIWESSCRDFPWHAPDSVTCVDSEHLAVPPSIAA